MGFGRHFLHPAIQPGVVKHEQAEAEAPLHDRHDFNDQWTFFYSHGKYIEKFEDVNDRQARGQNIACKLDRNR